ncbi:MAG: transketolase [Patescibacteria group bacterium]|jgi:transketolase
MNAKLLGEMATLLRRDSLEMTTMAKSGHPTSCLSCAEIMSVLFFDEMRYSTGNSADPNNDEFILSKGHSAPILYSALFHAGATKERLLDLRKISSNLEGHPVPRNFPWAKMGTGSLGQGLGVGVGMALAAKKQGRGYRTYVLMGDSEIAEGSVYEACELAVYYELDNLVAIVDVNRLGQRGETLFGHNVKAYEKRFSGFGWKVFTVDGHSIADLKRVFASARKAGKPVMILAKTFKGRGVKFLENKDEWHGKALDQIQMQEALIEVGEVDMKALRVKKGMIRKPHSVKFKFKRRKLKPSEFSDDVSTRKAYGEAIAALAAADSSVIALDAEVSNSTFSARVKDVNVDQFIESFIAEQNMVSMASGLAVKGHIVFASTFAAFLSRAGDQLRMASLSDVDLNCVGSHCGVSIGADGASQMGLSDIAFFRSLLGSTVLYPSDAVSAQALTFASILTKGVSYLRTTRAKTPILYKKKEKFPIGDFKVLQKSTHDRVVLVGSGITVHQAMRASYMMKKKVAVVDLYSVKPFKMDKFVKFVLSHGKKIVIAEDHYEQGGIGEMLAAGIVGTGIKMKHLCVRELPHSGKPAELLAKYGLDSTAYVMAVKGKW